MIPCPDDEMLVRYVDGALSVEDTERLDAHVAGCARCCSQRSVLRSLVADIGAPIGPEIDVRAHAHSVMSRLDAPGTTQRPPRLRRVWIGVSSAAACMLVIALVAHAPPESREWQSRGGIAVPSMARDVLVRPCTVDGTLVPLAPGAVLDADAPLTATFRNLGTAPAFLLLFAVDARHVIHWIAPQYSRPEDVPAAITIRPSGREEVLRTTAVFDDVSPGLLRIVAVVSPSPARVSDVEALEGSAWDDARLRERLPPGADVRDTLIEVRAGSRGGAR